MTFWHISSIASLKTLMTGAALKFTLTLWVQLLWVDAALCISFLDFSFMSKDFTQHLSFIFCTCLIFLSLGGFIVCYKKEMSDKLAALLTCYWCLLSFILKFLRWKLRPTYTVWISCGRGVPSHAYVLKSTTQLFSFVVSVQVRELLRAHLRRRRRTLLCTC